MDFFPNTSMLRCFDVASLAVNLKPVQKDDQTLLWYERGYSVETPNILSLIKPGHPIRRSP